MLCKILTPTLLDAHQIEGFDTRYKKKIAFLLDGTVVGLRTARKNSLLTRSTWSKKSKANSAQGLVLTSPAGLLLINPACSTAGYQRKPRSGFTASYCVCLRVATQAFGEPEAGGWSPDAAVVLQRTCVMSQLHADDLKLHRVVCTTICCFQGDSHLGVLRGVPACGK